MSTLDMDRVRATFDASRDFTVEIEEELAIVDPGTRSLAPHFDELQRAARVTRCWRSPSPAS
ncbi:MAG: hypothetical protein ACRDPC_08320 [Solirubrobacteraceae bacterium]